MVSGGMVLDKRDDHAPQSRISLRIEPWNHWLTDYNSSILAIISVLVLSFTLGRIVRLASGRRATIP
jgi:hypothetical protein